MTEDLVYFKSKTTGKGGYYPAHFGVDWPDFEEVDPNEENCIDCVVVLPEVKVTPATITTKSNKEGEK